MVLYHGTTASPFERFQTPTGLESWDVTRGGVIYLTSDIAVARKYAGKSGHVAKVIAPHARDYKSQLASQGREKKKKYTRNVYVALASEIHILEWIEAVDRQ